jgi:hypothetical protein
VQYPVPARYCSISLTLLDYRSIRPTTSQKGRADQNLTRQATGRVHPEGPGLFTAAARFFSTQKCRASHSSFSTPRTTWGGLLQQEIRESLRIGCCELRPPMWGLDRPMTT